MLTGRLLRAGIVRLLLVVILCAATVGVIAPDAYTGRPVIADNGGGDDGDGDGKAGKDREESGEGSEGYAVDEGDGDEEGGPAYHKKKNKNENKDKKEKKENKKKKDKKDKDRGRGKDDEEVVVIVAPDVTPIPAATASPQPEQRGSLRIVARTCPTRPADGAEWDVACALPVAKSEFELEALEGAFASWHRDIETDAAGEVTVDDLPVGRYDLEQTDDDWCRAESDRVDAEGRLVVEADQLTTVWIFNCPDPPAGS